MLSKTLKHDMRAILPLWMFLSVIALCSSFVLSFSIRTLITDIEVDGFALVFGVLGLFLSIAVLVGYMIATVIFIAVRFYQNFFTDEGYLTFTLPVKRSTLFFSKVLSGMIFIFASTAIVLASVSIALLTVPTVGQNDTPLLFTLGKILWSLVSELFQYMASDITMIFGTIVLCLIGLCLMVYGVLAIYLCITIGSVIAKKWKVVAAILCYYGANVVISIFSSIGQVLLLILSPSFFLVLSEMPQELTGVAILFLLVGILGFMIILLSAIYYITVHLIEKKLNLP